MDGCTRVRGERIQQGSDKGGSGASVSPVRGEEGVVCEVVQTGVGQARLVREHVRHGHALLAVRREGGPVGAHGRLQVDEGRHGGWCAWM